MIEWRSKKRKKIDFSKMKPTRGCLWFFGIFPLKKSREKSREQGALYLTQEHQPGATQPNQTFSGEAKTSD